jgi:hypothetical protein
MRFIMLEVKPGGYVLETPKVAIRNLAVRVMMWTDIVPTPAAADARVLGAHADVRGGGVGDMGFTLEVFKRYIAGLRKHPRGNIADDS